MSELSQATDRHMAHIVFNEDRPFCFVDFRRFEVDGKEYRMSHGTFRNEVSKRIRSGKVEREYNCGTAYYTLAGHRFGKPLMTPYHAGGILSSGEATVGRQTPLYKWLKNLPVEEQSLHNVRLRFEAENIWHICSGIYPQYINEISKDIELEPWKFNNDIDITITIHHTDTVTVAIACSYKPLATDVNGLVDCIEILVRTEERIAGILSKECKENCENVSVPSFRKWIGVMWHFGVDGIDIYDKEAFRVSIEEGLSDIYTIYTKRMKDGRLKPRIERQEYSKNPFVNIFLQKLYPEVA